MKRILLLSAALLLMASRTATSPGFVILKLDEEGWGASEMRLIN